LQQQQDEVDKKMEWMDPVIFKLIKNMVKKIETGLRGFKKDTNPEIYLQLTSS